MTTAQSLKIRKRFRSVLYQIVAIAIGILLVTPILYALVISFMPGEDILTIPPRFIPSRWITDNYKMAWTLTTLPRFMLNSLILAGVSVQGSVLDLEVDTGEFPVSEPKAKETIGIEWHIAIHRYEIKTKQEKWHVCLKMDVSFFTCKKYMERFYF